MVILTIAAGRRNAFTSYRVPWPVLIPVDLTNPASPAIRAPRTAAVALCLGKVLTPLPLQSRVRTSEKSILFRESRGPDRRYAGLTQRHAKTASAISTNAASV